MAKANESSPSATPVDRTVQDAATEILNQLCYAQQRLNDLQGFETDSAVEGVGVAEVLELSAAKVSQVVGQINELNDRIGRL